MEFSIIAALQLCSIAFFHLDPVYFVNLWSLLYGHFICIKIFASSFPKWQLAVIEPLSFLFMLECCHLIFHLYFHSIYIFDDLTCDNIIIHDIYELLFKSSVVFLFLYILSPLANPSIHLLFHYYVLAACSTAVTEWFHISYRQISLHGVRSMKLEETSTYLRHNKSKQKIKMADVETIKRATAQAAVKIMKAVIVEVTDENRRQTKGTCHHHAVENIRPHTGGSSLRQPVSDWNTRHKYTELKSFEMELTNIFLTFLTKHYEIHEPENANNKNLAKEGPPIHTGTNSFRARGMPDSKRTICCNSLEIQATTLGEYFVTVTLQIIRQCDELAEECMGHSG